MPACHQHHHGAWNNTSKWDNKIPFIQYANPDLDYSKDLVPQVKQILIDTTSLIADQLTTAIKWKAGKQKDSNGGDKFYGAVIFEWFKATNLFINALNNIDNVDTSKKQGGAGQDGSAAAGDDEFAVPLKELLKSFAVLDELGTVDEPEPGDDNTTAAADSSTAPATSTT